MEEPCAAPREMGAQETPPEEVLRAAAAEVSTPSAKRRLRLFRQTLPPLLAKVTESESDTKLLVELIFQTLPLYNDRASRKAVDEMVFQGLQHSTFMQLFAPTLGQCTKRNLKVSSQLACFKLIGWSIFLLRRMKQLGSLSERFFPKLASAQSLLFQAIMDGPLRRRRYFSHRCKELFSRLFSKSVDILEQYIGGLKDPGLSANVCPAFVNMILDFTMCKSPFSSEYKPVFLDLYVKTILCSNSKTLKPASEAFKPVLMEIGPGEFEQVLVPACRKMLTRNPEIGLDPIGYLLMMVSLDLSQCVVELMSVIVTQALHKDEERRVNALDILKSLSAKSSDPSTIFNYIKAVFGGSKGRLTGYQRLAMVKALEDLSNVSAEKISGLAPSVSGFLVMCYDKEGTTEVKLAALSALTAWASVSSEAVHQDVISCITKGLKAGDTLRKGHLNLIRVISKKSDSRTKISSLLDQLIELVETSFTKTPKWWFGIHSLYAVCKLASVVAKADGSIVDTKVWPLIAKKEHSVISVQLLSKLTEEDCSTYVDLLESLLVDHLFRVQEYFSVQSSLQVLMYLVCHPSWEVRKIASDATKNVLSSCGALAQDLLFLFTDWLTLIGERVSKLKQSDIDSSEDSELPFIPSAAALVKCLFLIAPYAVDHSQKSYSGLMLCSHNPCISSFGSPAGVWKWLQRSLKQQKIELTDLISPNISAICKELLSEVGLFSSNKQQQRAALCSLSSLMKISPSDTFTEFEKHFVELLGVLHRFSENDIKIFFTSDGQLCNEGIFPDLVREKRLKEESTVRQKVTDVQKKCTLMLDAFGEMVIIAKRKFTEDQLPHLAHYIQPLLSSPFLSEAALRAMVKLARCTSSPLDNWAPEIADAFTMMHEDIQKIVTRLTRASTKKSIPSTSFIFIFPIMERILLSLKNTSLKDDVLKILSKHPEHLLLLPPERIFSVLYHVLSSEPASYVSIGPMLNKLCQCLNCNDLSQALIGVYAKEVHVRKACLTAIMCVPGDSMEQDLEVSTILLIAIHDADEAVAVLAMDLWKRFGFAECTNYSGIVDALSYKNYNVRAAAAEALAALLKKNSQKMHGTLSTLMELYSKNLDHGVQSGDTNWLGRQGIALALHSLADALGSKELCNVVEFIIFHASADPNMDVRSRMIDTGIHIIDKRGEENVSLLLPIFENYMNKRDSEDLVREAVVKLTDALAKYLGKGDAVQAMVQKLLTVLAPVADQTNIGRTITLNLSCEYFLEHIKRIKLELFDLVRLEGDLGIGLPANYFVSLGDGGSNAYDMLFQLLEYHHSRSEVLGPFDHKQILYIPRFNSLVFTAEVKIFRWSIPIYQQNIRDAGAVLDLLRYSPAKVDKPDPKDPAIFELDRTKSELPPYLKLLVAKMKIVGTANDGRSVITKASDGKNAQWRSVYRNDLAGKRTPVRIAILIVIDLHLDRLSKDQKTELWTSLGNVKVHWVGKAEDVPTIKATVDHKYYDEITKRFKVRDYDEEKLISLCSCGRNHVTHAELRKMSEKEAEAIFSCLFHRELSNIVERLTLEYKEPKPIEGKEENTIKLMEVISMR